jgi:nucleoside-diphosphate-sugar epimerase
VAIHATGISGTIGKHLSNKVLKLDVNLLDKVFSIPRDFFGENDSVIHLAGIVGSQKVQENSQLSYRVNVESTAQLALQLQRSSIKKFLYISSSHVYELSDKPLRETDPVLPKSMYAVQKREAEVALLEIFSSTPERLCVARVFSVLDWDMHPFTLGGGITRLRDENSDSILSHGGDIRDFLTPKTVASGLLAIAQNDDLHGILNVCSGRGISVKDAALTMLKGVNCSTHESRIDPGISGAPHIVGDNSKLRNALPALDLNWTPSTST